MRNHHASRKVETLDDQSAKSKLVNINGETPRRSIAFKNIKLHCWVTLDDDCDIIGMDVLRIF